MKVHELQTALKTSGPAPLYLVVGDEDYLRDRAVAAIKAAAVSADGGLGDFNVDVLYGDETDAAEILAKAEEVPAFAVRRCVIVKAADKLPAREGERLLEYMKQPADSTTLVFVGPKVDGRTKFGQAMKGQAVTVDCGQPFDPQMPEWVRQHARAMAAEVGVGVNDDALDLLTQVAVSLKDSAGGVLYLLRRELEKLASYVPPGSVAGAAEVHAVRGGEGGASVFDLSLAIASRDRPRALRILARNLETGEDPLRILGSLIWQYRKIWRLKESLRQGGPEAEAARTFRMPPFKVRDFLARFSDAHLAAAFRLFLETDSKLKGGAAAASRGRTLEALLLRLCAPEDTPRGEPPALSGARTQPQRTTSNIRTVKRFGGT